MDVMNNSVIERGVDVITRGTFTLRKRARRSSRTIFSFLLGIVVRAEVELLGSFVGLDTFGHVADVRHGDGVEGVTGSVVDFDVDLEVGDDTGGTLSGEELAFLLLVMMIGGSREKGSLLVMRVVVVGFVVVVVVVAVHYCCLIC